MAKHRRGSDRRPAPGSPVPARAESRSEGGTTSTGRPAPAASPVRRVIFATIGTLAALLFVSLGGFPGSRDASPPPAPTASAAAEGPGATPSPSPSAPTATQAVAAPVISGIACDVDEKTAYHVHAHVNIRIDGALRLIPADVGFGPGCLFWLHTHAPYGVIHVEAPTETAFTLGQFFDVWGQSLSATHVAGRAIGPGESLYTFVDRERFNGDPRAILLGDLVAIELQVGTEPLEPLPYTFPVEFE